MQPRAVLLGRYPPAATCERGHHNVQSAPYIGPALESVFAQSRQADEVILVDDGSTDETPERIAPYRDRLVYVRQANQGRRRITQYSHPARSRRVAGLSRRG